MNRRDGYTLVELVMAVSLLIIVTLGGTAIFYRSFRSSGVSDKQSVLNSSLRLLDEMIEQNLRYGSVISVENASGQKLRSDCVTSGLSELGVSGDKLEFKDASGGVAVYSLLEDGTVSSNSGVIVSNPEIVVTKLVFTWYCRSGVNDKINLYIEANSGATTGEVITGKFNKDINLLNSGIN